MSCLPFESLLSDPRRLFLGREANAKNWGSIEPLFVRLQARASDLLSVEDLEGWLLEWGELSAMIEEEGAKRYIAMTCNTEDSEAEQSYLQFVEEIEPRCKPLQFDLSKTFINHPIRSFLSSDRYETFVRSTNVQVELFRTENIPLETEESRIGQQYQKLCGSLTVQFQNEERTLTQMGRFLEEPDRQVRETTWRLIAERRIQECGTFNQQFDELIRIRHRIAKNAGFTNYRDYAFRLRGRFDYSPDDCLRFHEAIEKEVMPLIRQLQAERRKGLGLIELRPWDLSVDPSNQAPLKPFKTVDEMADRSQRVFDRLDPQLGDEFRLMRQLRLLDLDNRKGKAPGGYQSTLSESRLPFIFMNAVGVQRDVETILHEAGHAFHALAARNEDLFAYRSAPIEFCEVASMSMELLGGEFVSEFYPETDAHRARRDHLEGVVEVFPWIATVDAFQHWIYTHTDHTSEDRSKAWRELMARFQGDVQWSGLDSYADHLWQRQLHIFLYPFYYIEYAIAQLGALQIWNLAKQDRNAALQSYKSSLRLGGSKALPKLFSAAGCRLDFSAATLRPLMEMLRKEIQIPT